MSQDMLGIVADFVEKLRNGSISEAEAKRFLRREDPFSLNAIDLFNPVAFIGQGWEVVGTRKVLPGDFDPMRLNVAPTPLSEGETWITGDETKRRLTKRSLAGVEAFARTWEQRDQLPIELRGKVICFDGDELRSPSGSRSSLCLYWRGDRWGWDYDRLDDDRDASCVSALAS